MTVDSFEIQLHVNLHNSCRDRQRWLLRAMYSFTDVEFEAALSNSLQHFHHISGLKHDQKLCLETVAQKRDVFGILPTGFGKSLIFQLLPCLLKDLCKLQSACVLVVTPLVSIMKDQVEELPVALSSSIAFPSLLRFAEGVSPVGDRTAVGRLELLVGVVH